MSFFTNETIRDEDLPLPEHRRDPSPDNSGSSFWGALWEFFAGTAPVKDSELPEAGGRLSPARESKRLRDEDVPHQTFTVVKEDTVETLLKDSPATLTVANLTEYLHDNGVQVPPSAKKADLLKLARAASEQSEGRKSSAELSRKSTAELSRKSSVAAAPESQKTVGRQSSTVGRQSSTATTAPVVASQPTSTEPSQEEEQQPTLKWTLVQLKEYAEAHKIKLPANAIKPDIFDIISQHPEFRRNASVKRVASTSQAAVVREESKSTKKK